MKLAFSQFVGFMGGSLPNAHVMGDEPIGIEQQRRRGRLPSYALHRQGREAFGPRGEP